MLIPLVSLVSWSTYHNRWGHLFSDWHEIRYTDLRPITANLSCLLSDPTWSIDGPSCDPWQRPLNYPSLWLTIFRYLGLDDQRVLLAGILISIMTILGLAILFSVIRDSFTGLLLGVVLSISPPVFFVIERGNVDGAIFFILIVASLLITSRALSLRLIGSTLIVLAGILKVFPIGSLLVFIFWQNGSRIHAKVRILFTGISAILIATYLIPQAKRMFSGTPSFPAMQFGVRTLPIEIFECIPKDKSFGYCSWSSSIEYAIGFALILACFIGVLVLNRLSTQSRLVFQQYFSTLLKSQLQLSMFVIFAGAFSFTFFLGSNWYYRLIFLIPIALISIASKTQLGYLISAGVLIASFSIAGNVLYLHIVAQVVVSLLVVIFIRLLCLLLVHHLKQAASH